MESLQICCIQRSPAAKIKHINKHACFMSLFFAPLRERLQNVKWKLLVHEITRSFEHVVKHELLIAVAHWYTSCNVDVLQ